MLLYSFGAYLISRDHESPQNTVETQSVEMSQPEEEIRNQRQVDFKNMSGNFVRQNCINY